MLAARPLAGSGPEALAPALATVLLGLLTVLLRRGKGPQLAGLLGLENGVGLAAVTVPGTLLVPALAAAWLGLAALLLGAAARRGGRA